MGVFDDLVKKTQQGGDDSSSGGSSYQPPKTTGLDIVDKKIKEKSGATSASQSLQNSLEGVEKNTALSTGMLGEYRDSAVNFFDNARHTITDKDEEHGIKDYSQYKMYKSALDNAEPGQDVDAIYKQMADENVIDYNKFSSRVNSDEYKKDNADKYENYKKAVENIKQGLSDDLDNALSQYMPKVDDGSYQLNALTKAKSEMLDQAAMFVDSYAETYKSTRDPELIKDFDKIWDEYKKDVVGFTQQRAKNLTTKDESGLKAYYDTLNDSGMKELAQGIRKLQRQAENKQSAAAMKSNFGDARDAFTKGQIQSSAAELIGGGMNAVNWLLDKVGDVTEYTKEATTGRYDVVEELANLNVYANNAGYLEKTFGTMASRVGEIVDGAPTLVPMVVDLVAGSKAGVISKGDDVIDIVRRIDKFRPGKKLKDIVQGEDIIINAANDFNMGIFKAKWLSEGIQNIALFDIIFQQFEGRPLTDEDLTTNFLMNLPLDAISAAMSQAPKIIAKDLKAVKGFEDVFTSDEIDKDLYSLLQKHYKANEKIIKAGESEGASAAAKAQAEEVYKQAQEKFYMYNSMKARNGEKLLGEKTVSLGDDLLDSFIKKSRDGAEGVYKRLSTFGGSLDEYLMEAQSIMSSKAYKKLSYEEAANKAYNDYIQKSELHKTAATQARVYSNLTLLTDYLAKGKVTEFELKEIIERSLGADDVLGRVLNAMFTGTKEDFVKVSKELDAAGEEISREEISKKLDKVMAELISEDPSKIEVGEMISGYIREQGGTFANLFTGEKGITLDTLEQRLGKSYNIGAVQKTTHSRQLGNIIKSIQSGELVADEGFFDITQGFDNALNPNWTKKDLQSNSQAMVANNIYKSRGFKIVEGEDGKLHIMAKQDAIEKLKKDIDGLKNLKGKKTLSSDEMSAINFIFAKDRQRDVENNLKAINQYRKESGMPLLTAKEIKGYVDEHKTWFESSFRDVKKEQEKRLKKAKEIYKKKSGVEMSEEKTEQVVKSERTKAGTMPANEELEPAISEDLTEEIMDVADNVINGDATMIDLEKASATASITDMINKAKEAVRKEILDKYENEKAGALFRLSHGYNNTLFEGFKDILVSRLTFGGTELPDLKNVERLALQMSQFVGQFLKDGDDIPASIIECISKAAGSLAITPRTVSMLNENSELLSLMLTSGLSRDDKASTALFKKVSGLFRKALDESENAAEKLKARTLYGNILDIAQTLPNISRRGMIDQTLFNVKLREIVDMSTCSDYFKGVEALSKPEGQYFNGVAILDLRKLSGKELDQLADDFAKRTLLTNGIISKSLFDNIKSGFKKGINRVINNSEAANIPLEFDPRYFDEFFHGVRDNLGANGNEMVLFGMPAMSTMLGALEDGKTVFQNIVMHEYGHAEMLLKKANRGKTTVINDAYRMLEDKTLGNSFIDKVARLKEAREFALTHAGDNNKESLIYLENYIRQGGSDETLDGIIEKFNKQNLIEYLVSKRGGEDNVNLYNYMQDLTGDLEEYINELQTYARLGRLGVGDINSILNVEKVNQCLKVLEQYGEAVDRVRYLSMKKDGSVNETTLRNILRGVFDINKTYKNKNIADEVMSKIYKAAKDGGDPIEEANKMRKVLGLTVDGVLGGSKAGVEGINKDIVKVRKAVRQQLGLLKTDKKLLEESGLSEEEVNTLFDLASSKDTTQFNLLLSYLDVYQYVPNTQKLIASDVIDKGTQHIVDAEYTDIGGSVLSLQAGEATERISADEYGNVIISKTKLYNPAEETIENGKVVADESKEYGYKTHKQVKSTTSLMGVAEHTIGSLKKKVKMTDKVPVIKTVSTMGHDAGIFATDVFSIVNRMVGDTKMTISKNKLLVGDNVVEAAGDEDLGMFVTNRTVASLLSAINKYDENTVNLINQKLSYSKIDSAIGDISGMNSDNPDTFISLFNHAKENFGMQEGFGDLVKGDVSITSEEPLLDEKQWKKAFKAWKSSGEKTQTIGKFFDFGRGKIRVNGKTYDMQKYEDYQEYYKLRENTQFAEYRTITRDIDVDTVLNNVHPGSIRGLNEAMVEYLNARKFGNSVTAERAIQKVNRRFKQIIEDAGSPRKLNFRFTSQASEEGTKGYNVIDEMNDIAKMYSDGEGGILPEGQLKLMQIAKETKDTIASHKEISRENVNKSKMERISLYSKDNEVADPDELFRKGLEEQSSLGMEGMISLEDLISKEELEDMQLYDDYINEFGGAVEAPQVSSAGAAFNDVIESYVNDGLFEQSISKYNIEYNPDKYLIDEKEGGLSDKLTINLGAHYNSIDPDDLSKANEVIDDMFQETIKDTKKEGFKADEYYNVTGRLKSFANNSFVDGNLLKLGSVYGVDSLFGKVINGKTIANIQVVFGNGHSMLYSKDGLRLSREGDPRGLMSDIANSMLREKGGLNIRYLTEDGEHITSKYFMSDDIWKSYVGQDLLSAMGINDLIPDISEISDQALIKMFGIEGGTDEVAKYKDLFSLVGAFGEQGAGFSNEDVFKKISAKLGDQIQNNEAHIFFVNEARKKAIGKDESLEKNLQKELDRCYEKNNALRKTKAYIDSNMYKRGYETVSISNNDVQIWKELRIDGSSKYYDKNGNPRRSGREKYVKRVTYTEGSDVPEVKFVEAEVNNFDTKETIMLENTVVYKDRLGNVIKEEPLHNYYEVVGVKPKVDVYNSVINEGYGKVDYDEDADGIVESREQSFFLNQGKKGGYLLLDEIEIQGEQSALTWKNIDEKISEIMLDNDNGRSLRVNKDDGEVILVMRNADGEEVDVLLKKVIRVNPNTNTTYPAYRMFFGADAGDLGLAITKDRGAYEYYKETHVPIKIPELKIDTEIGKWKKEVQKKREDYYKNKPKEKRSSGMSKDELQHIISRNNKEEGDDILKLMTNKDVKLGGVSRLVGTNDYLIKVGDKNIIYRSSDYSIIPIKGGALSDNVTEKVDGVKDVGEFFRYVSKRNKLSDEGPMSKPGDVGGFTLRGTDKPIDNMFGDEIYPYSIPLSYSRGRQLALQKVEAKENKGTWVTGWKDSRSEGTFVDGKWKRGEVIDDTMPEFVKPVVDDYEKQLDDIMLKASKGDYSEGELKLKREKIGSRYRELFNKQMKLESLKRALDKATSAEDVKRIREQIKELTDEISKLNTSGYDKQGLSPMLKSIDEDITTSIKEQDELKTITKTTEEISNMEISKKIDDISRPVNDILAFTNYDLMGETSSLSQIMGANNNFKRVFGERLKTVVKKRDDSINTLNEEDQAFIFKNIREACNNMITHGRSRLEDKSVIFTNADNQAKEAINELVQIYKDSGRHYVYLLDKITNPGSMDAMMQKTFNSYNNAAIGLMNLKDSKSVREYVQQHALKLGASNKRAEDFAKDFVGDPLGTGKMMTFLANVRSAYRFAKYSLLSPISGTIMYLNSVIMSEPLLKSKKSGLSMYYNNDAFKKLIGEENVTSWLERDDDIIFQGFNGMQMNGLRVDNQLQKLADILGKPFGEKTRKKIQAATMGGIHSIYDLQRSGEVRVYAFAQALKQNHVITDKQLEDLLKKVKDGSINEGTNINLWRSIMADTEINYGRFFTNANTSALSRHRRSRAYGFNFLQGYVINRADEMVQGIRKLYNFGKEKGFKNLTRDDITKHLAEDNVEMKAFLNNIILSAKMGYYLDRADGDEKTNMRQYFIDTNDYLSSLNTTWFMRLLMSPYEGTRKYLEYTEFAKQDPTMIGGVSSAAYQFASDISSMFFREGKFLNAMVNTLVAGMQTGDLNFAATVAGTEREKMANGLGRFGLVEGIESYGLEDFSEASDIIGQLLLNGNETTRAGEIKSKIYDISQIDSLINDPTYATVTAFGYLPVVGEMIKHITGNGGYGFSEAKYKEMMNMVENDKNLQELYKGSLNTELYSNEAINRIWNDFTAFNYPSKSLKDLGKHSVGSFSEGKDITLNSMKEDVFVQNICEKLGMSIEEFHKYITADYTNNAKKTGLMKIMAASEAAEPGSGHIVLSYIMSNKLYELEKQITGNQYPTAADVGEENMNELKRIVLEQYGDMMFTADKASRYKAIREYISEANPAVFKTLYKNETLNGYTSSIGFLDSLMRDASQKGDVDAKYIKNAFSVVAKYMKDDTARTTAVEYLFNQIDKMDMPEGVRRMTMEGVLAGNIDFYNHLKNSVVLSTLYKDALDSFEHRVWGTLQTDVADDGYRTQRKGYSKYNPYTSNYGDRNGQVEDELKNKANKYFPMSSPKGTTSGYRPRSSYIPSSKRPTDTLNWNWNYYEQLIKDFSEKLVKSEAKKYPGDRDNTFLSREENIGKIEGAKLSFKKHKQPKYSTSVLSNMPGSRG